jgi:uncharacterized protein YjbI with pentapeptide repeats
MLHQLGKALFHFFQALHKKEQQLTPSPTKVLALTGDWSYQDLCWWDLEGAVLQGTYVLTNFTGSNLRRTKAVGGNFERAQLRGVHLDHAKWDHARLTEASLEGASLCETSLRHACLDGAVCSYARLDRANLSHASLKHAYLDQCRGHSAVFDHIQGTGLWLQESHIQQSSWVGADLERARASFLDASGSNFSQANFCHAFLVHGNFCGANLADTLLGQADLREAKRLASQNQPGRAGCEPRVEGADIEGIQMEAPKRRVNG